MKVEEEANAQWFVNKDETILGPFTQDALADFLIIGRVHIHCEVSVDLFFWEPIHQVPQLIHEDMLNLKET